MPVEGVLKSVDLVALGEKEMEESDNCTFELSALLSSDGNWGETSPENVFADVCGYKERDTTSKSIALLKELVKKDNDNTSGEELEKNENGVESSQVREFTVHS